jgi:hypothetical protein
MISTMNAADLLFTYVANGVTTVRDMHSGSPLVDPWMPALRRRIASGELLGPRIYAAGDPDNSSAEAVTKSLEAMKAAGYDFVKLYGLPRPKYDWVVQAARQVGLPVVGHASTSLSPVVNYAKHPGIPGALHDHWASVEHLFAYFEYTTGVPFISGWMSEGPLPPKVADTTLRRVARETAQAGVWNCPTLTILWENSMGAASSAPDSVRVWLVDFYQRLLRALQAEGAGLLLGTDSGRSANAGSPEPSPILLGGFAIHRELELLVEAGLTPYQALATGTRDVARFLGTLDSTGTIAVGKRADLVLLKGNPLVHIQYTAALAGVMVGGRWLPRAALEQQIDSLAPVPIPDSLRGTTNDRARAASWGSMDTQIRVLSRVLWR